MKLSEMNLSIWEALKMSQYEIIKDGRCEYFIVTSEFADVTEHFAASELQKYIYQSTNVFIPYFSDRCPRRGKEILVGKAARDNNADIDDVGDEGYVIRTLASDILIAGNTPRGTMYGVYAFLERFLGFRAFTKDVEKIDALAELTIGSCDIREKPAFEYREAYFRFAWDTGFSVKNKLNANLAPIPLERGGLFKFFNCHHSFFDLVPPKYYKETHPEYFSVREDDKVGTQLCLSNPGVVSVAKAQLRRWIRENPTCKVFSIAQNDEVGYCQCPNCRKIDEENGSPSGSIITFVNKLAEDIEKDYPDILLHTFAYAYSEKTPSKVKPRKNVIVRIANIDCHVGAFFDEWAKKGDNVYGARNCRLFMENLSAWTAVCERVYIWGYAVNFRNYLQPLLPIKEFAHNLRLYAKYGVKGVLMQGNFSYGGDASMGDLKAYLFSKLLWNPDADENKIVGEFIDGVYGKGAPYIKEYVRLMSEAVSDRVATIFDNADAEYYSDELIAYCDKLFEQAEAVAETEEIRRRINREHLAMEFMKTVRIEDDERRAEAAENLKKKVIDHKLTEINERINLPLSFEYIKKSRYEKERKNWYNMYYIVR
ncbi:MAG TPA: hypothetical protein DDY70_01060 [Clostridiales bacterium]|nr:hypothetical protein [Clostridiales bacterium]